MAKLRVQAQHLMPGDVVGSKEVVHSVIVSSVRWPTSKCCVRMYAPDGRIGREAMWGKQTMINVTRGEEGLHVVDA